MFCYGEKVAALALSSTKGWQIQTLQIHDDKKLKIQLPLCMNPLYTHQVTISKAQVSLYTA